MSDFDEFLLTDVRGNLFRDLEAMRATTFAFPLAMTACAGIELLGLLLSPTEFDPDEKGVVHFLRYWNEYLYPSDPSKRELGNAVYQLIRHGIAHGFVLKGPFGIGCSQGMAHLSRYGGGAVYIDAAQLAADVLISFRERVEPIIAGRPGSPSYESMSKTFMDLRDECRRKLAIHLPARLQAAEATIDSARLSTSAMV